MSTTVAPPDPVAEAHLKLAGTEIAEALSDVFDVLRMPNTEARVAKLAGCVAGFERATNRIRYDVLKQERPVDVEGA